MSRSFPPFRMSSVRPLVRYVDQERAVIDVRVFLEFGGCDPDYQRPIRPRHVNLLLEVDGDDGFRDELDFRVPLVGDYAVLRYELVCPQRWWPAGMGEQPLYQITVSAAEIQPMESVSAVFGLTSVRRNAGQDCPLLVHGQECPINQVLAVDAIDEKGFLPMAAGSLVLVRGHYGPDVLYDAADRAGILLVQAVPIHAGGMPETEMVDQIDRLLSHPSLAGWFVGHLGAMTERIAYCITSLDPTRSVFRAIPGAA